MKRLKANWLPLAGVIFLGFAIRAAMGWARWGDMGGDELLYAFAGRALFHGRGLITPGGEPLISFHPAIAFLLGFFNLFIKDSELVSDLLFAGAGALCALPVYLLSRDMYNRTVGIVAALITVTMPFFATALMEQDFTNTASVTVLSVFMGLWFAHMAYTKYCLPCFAYSGMWFGVAYLTRPEGFVWLPVIAAGGFILGIRNSHVRAKIMVGVAVMIIGAGIFMVPYIYWLHEKTGNWTLSAKAGSDILASNWSESAQIEIDRWKAEHPSTPIDSYSTARFFMENPDLLVAKLTFNSLRYFDRTCKVLSGWLLVAGACFFLYLLCWRRGFRNEIFLLVAAMPLLVILLSNVFARHLVYWIPIFSIWGARLFQIIIDRKRWVGVTLVCLALASNLAMNLNNIVSTRLKVPHNYARIPARWLDAKVLPDETGYTPDLKHGFFGSLHQFIHDAKFPFDDIYRRDYFIADPKWPYLMPEFKSVLESEPAMIGNMSIRDSVMVDGKKVLIYQKRDIWNPVRDRPLTQLPAMDLQRILYIDPAKLGGTVWSIDETDAIGQNADYIFRLNELEASRQPVHPDTLLPETSSNFLKDKRIEAMKRDLLNAAQMEFRNAAFLKARENGCWMVLEIRGATGINIPWSFNTPPAGEDAPMAMHYGKLVFLNSRGDKNGWINMRRLLLSTPQGKKIRDTVRVKFMDQGIAQVDLKLEIITYENLGKNLTQEQLNRWVLVSKILDDRTAIFKIKLQPYKNELNDLMIDLIAKVRDYGNKNNYALIYDISDFACHFDPYTRDQEITASMLGIE